jgi:hypothetical protein
MRTEPTKEHDMRWNLAKMHRDDIKFHKDLVADQEKYQARLLAERLQGYAERKAWLAANTKHPERHLG